MIFGRFVQRLKQQKWSAIAIELMIVVVGVFIGLQVDNWNESRREAQRGHEYVARIGSDLAEDIQSMDVRLEFWDRVIDHGQGAIRYAETGELVNGSAWKTVLSFYQASQLYPYVPQDATYQEMRNAGDLGLIDDQSLRAALANYYVTGPGFQANILLELQPEYRKIVRGLTPAVVSSHVWAHCHKSYASNLQVQVLIDCASPVSEADAQAVLVAYLANPQLLPELRFWITNLEVSQGLVEKQARRPGACRPGATGGRTMIFHRSLQRFRQQQWGAIANELAIVVVGVFKRALTVLDGGAPMDDDTLLVSAYRANQYINRVRARSTYDELNSTGTIALIRGQALRDTAMRIYNDATIESMTRIRAALFFASLRNDPRFSVLVKKMGFPE